MPSKRFREMDPLMWDLLTEWFDSINMHEINFRHYD